MAELTKEWLKQTIAEYEANRDELPFGLDTNSAIELQAFKLALASLEADPVAYIFKHPAGKLFWALTDESNKEQADVIPVYAAPPVPVVPAALPENDDEDGHDIDYLEPSEVYSLGRTAGWNACRAAMLQGADVSITHEGKNHHKDKLAMVDHSGDSNNMVEPVTTTYKLPFEQWLSKQTGTIDVECGCVMTEVFFNWLRVAYDAGNSPVTPDGWISCSERMPKETGDIIVVSDGIVMSGISYSRRDGFYIAALEYDDDEPIGGVTHWMPLPEPPQEVK